jgi:hypothetical protein
MNTRSTRSNRVPNRRARRAPLAWTTSLALLAASASVGCGQGAQGSAGDTSGPEGGAQPPGQSSEGGAPATEDSGPPTGPQGTPDAGAAPGPDAGTPPPADAGGGDGASSGAGPACASNASISAILAQYGSDPTTSSVTPMGARFEAAAQALPISAANLASLSTASSNPDVSQATSATGLSWGAAKVQLFPSGAPTPEDIMQHDIGDCDGDSAMASMAYVNPALVRSVIKDNGDGTFDIAMFDPMGKPITVVVDSQVLVDGSGTIGQVSAADGQSADWATILEKAVMKYDAAYGMVGAIDGIGSETLIPMFTGTGGSIAIPTGSLTPQQFQQVVTVSLAAGKFITGGFSQDGLTIGQDSTVTAHGYAMMVPTDPATDMSDMRNPWGVNPWATGSSNSGYDTSTDGLLHIPLATSPTNWPQIIDLRIIDPGPSCTGVSAPFTPHSKHGSGTRIHIREPHAR